MESSVIDETHLIFLKRYITLEYLNVYQILLLKNYKLIML
jgi:hypothetical protein